MFCFALLCVTEELNVPLLSTVDIVPIKFILVGWWL